MRKPGRIQVEAGLRAASTLRNALEDDERRNAHPSPNTHHAHRHNSMYQKYIHYATPFVAEDKSETLTPAPRQSLVARQATKHEKIAGCKLDPAQCCSSAATLHLSSFILGFSLPLVARIVILPLTMHSILEREILYFLHLFKRMEIVSSRISKTPMTKGMESNGD